MKLCCGVMVDLSDEKPEMDFFQARKKGAEVELAKELKERHENKLELSEVQYHLWAHTITTEIHSSKDTPPRYL